jgi:NAD(P)-dependent dehydrogenase (short-subunit alcohol dehydrogenase family)
VPREVIVSEHAKPPFLKQKQPMAGRILMAGDLGHPDHCRADIEKATAEIGGVDILVNNTAHQATFKSIEDITDEEWELTFRTNIHSMFYLTEAAVPHMKKGGAIINTASINSDTPNPTLRLRERRHSEFHGRTGAAARRERHPGQCGGAGPNMDPTDPSTMPEDAVTEFGKMF